MQTTQPRHVPSPPGQQRPQALAGDQAANASAPAQPRTQAPPNPGTPPALQAPGAVPVWDPPQLPAARQSVWSRLGFGRKGDQPEADPTAQPAQQQPAAPMTQRPSAVLAVSSSPEPSPCADCRLSRTGWVASRGMSGASCATRGGDDGSVPSRPWAAPCACLPGRTMDGGSPAFGGAGCALPAQREPVHSTLCAGEKRMLRRQLLTAADMSGARCWR